MATKSYTLKNKHGLAIEFLSLGAKIKSIQIPNGANKVDITLGYDTIEEYEAGDTYLGAICGRYANRIAMGQFTLNGKTYQLAQNDRSNHLHGGLQGFNAKTWNVEPMELEDYTAAFKLKLESPDGHENYPGNLKVQVVYALNNENELLIDLHAISDKDTIINLTCHPYFNLNGVGNGKIFNHELKIIANSFTPLSELSVPTGEIRSVKGCDMDFNAPVKLSERINSNYEQIKKLGGLDHNWVLNKKENDLALAGVLSEPNSGRSIEVYTTQPGLQVYTAMHFDGSQKGKNQIPFTPYCAIAMEAQNFPDAPNKENFPNAVLKANEKYHEIIKYKFKF